MPATPRKSFKKVLKKTEKREAKKHEKGIVGYRIQNNSKRTFSFLVSVAGEQMEIFIGSKVDVNKETNKPLTAERTPFIEFTLAEYSALHDLDAFAGLVDEFVFALTPLSQFTPDAVNAELDPDARTKDQADAQKKADAEAQAEAKKKE